MKASLVITDEAFVFTAKAPGIRHDPAEIILEAAKMKIEPT